MSGSEPIPLSAMVAKMAHGEQAPPRSLRGRLTPAAGTLCARVPVSRSRPEVNWVLRGRSLGSALWQARGGGDVFGLPRRYERVGFALYGRVVEAARAPFLYRDLGVPDTLDGRFDLVGLFAFLMVRRLEAEPPAGHRLAQAVFDAMFSDMDVTLREMGVGDLSVGKRVKAMWEAFHGRSAAYAAALAVTDDAALEAALARNVWRGRPQPGSPAALARLVRAEDRHLAGQPFAAFASGAAGFLAAPA